MDKFIDFNDLLYNPDKFLKTKEDLYNVRNIRISQVKIRDLNILREFPNLERLEIINPDYEKISDQSDGYNPYINDIGSYEALRYLNLKSIKIVNDTKIKELDLSHMKRLSKIELINNPSLRKVTVVGESNKNKPLHLKNVIMYGNHITCFPNLDYYIFHTLDADKNIVDLSIYFSFINSINDAKKLNDLYIKGLTNIQFSEKNGQVGYLGLDIPLITELYTHFFNLFSRKKLFGLSNEEKIEYVYKYITGNVTLAKDELYERQKMYFELIDKYGSIPEFFNRSLGSLHTSYYAYHFKKSNCEGMVNLMKFCLSILVIDCEDVHCHDIRDRREGTNHAVLRAKYNGAYSYFDPSYRSQKSLKNDYFNMSYDKISSYIDLCKFEKDISYKSYIKLLNIIKHNNKKLLIRYYSWLLGRFSNDKENEFKRQNMIKDNFFKYYLDREEELHDTYGNARRYR